MSMSIESLQTLGQIIALVGLVATAVGGFGSYYFGHKADEARVEDFRTRLDGLSEDGKALAGRLEPFYELAETFAVSPQYWGIAGTRDCLILRNIGMR